MKTNILANDVWVTNTVTLIIMFGIIIFTYLDMERIRYEKIQKSFDHIMKLTISTFIMYIVIILYATLFCREEVSSFQHIFRPLTSYKAMIHGYRKAIYDNIQNVLFFIPFGMYLFFFYQNKIKWYHVFLCSAIFSGCIETTQLFTHLGCCQTADVINNATGGLIGFQIAFFLHTVIMNKQTSHA